MTSTPTFAHPGRDYVFIFSRRMAIPDSWNAVSHQRSGNFPSCREHPDGVRVGAIIYLQTWLSLVKIYPIRVNSLPGCRWDSPGERLFSLSWDLAKMWMFLTSSLTSRLVFLLPLRCSNIGLTMPHLSITDLSSAGQVLGDTCEPPGPLRAGQVFPCDVLRLRLVTGHHTFLREEGGRLPHLFPWRQGQNRPACLVTIQHMLRARPSPLLSEQLRGKMLRQVCTGSQPGSEAASQPFPAALSAGATC